MTRNEKRGHLLALKSNPCQTCGWQRPPSEMVFTWMGPGHPSLRIADDAFRVAWERVEMHLSQCIVECRSCSDYRNKCRQILAHDKEGRVERLPEPATDAQQNIYKHEVHGYLNGHHTA